MRSLPAAITVTIVLAAACARGDARAGRGAAAGRDGDDSVRLTGRIGICWRSPTITTGGIAGVRVGRTVASLARGCVVHDTTFSLGEGMAESAKVVRSAGHEVVALTTGTSGVISRVTVVDPAFHTATGVAVGATLGALRAAYGGEVCAALGDGTVVVRSPRLPGVSFALDTDPGHLPAGGRALARDPSSLPDSARVTRVWMYEPGLDGSGECGG